MFFAKQLAAWFCTVDWHYSTLLSALIECANEIPNDGNDLINELLLEHTVKPPQSTIIEFLLSNERMANWFRGNQSGPVITHFALQTPSPVTPVQKPLPAINTIEDLGNWLSLNKQELEWFANFWRSDASTPEHFKHYWYDLLEKRDGSMRLIEKPKLRLKTIQQKIYREILSSLEIHPAAHGFCKNRSCVSHASNHVGKRYLMQYDITDCFHSINWTAIKSVFLRLGYTQEVSAYLTALCSHRVQLDYQTRRLFNLAQQERFKQRHLPQGAPTSPALVNAALHRLDIRLTGLANTLKMDYSRYADDIAMSSNSHRDWRFLEPLVASICLDEGVSLNHKKTRIQRQHQKQRLVGIVVNTKTNIDRKYFDALKATLTNCKRYGIESQNRDGHPNYRAHLFGCIQYVKSLNENKGFKLERIFLEIGS